MSAGEKPGGRLRLGLYRISWPRMNISKEFEREGLARLGWV